MTSKKASYIISATSRSGDVLGADLVSALKHPFPNLKPHGIGGKAMDIATVNIIGPNHLWQKKSLFDRLRSFAQTRLQKANIFSKINEVDPKFAVLIDSSDFQNELSDYLKKLGIPTYHYNSKSLRSLNKKTLETIKSSENSVFGIFDSDSPFATSNGINLEYVGSPFKARTDKIQAKREALDLPADKTIFACLPGSTLDAIRRVAPKLNKVISEIKESVPDSLFVIPVSENIGAPSIGKLFSDDFKLVDGMSLEVMASADVCLVNGGTSSMECALVGTPFATINQHSHKESQINLLADKPLVSDFKYNSSASEIASHMIELLINDKKKSQLLEDFSNIKDRLQGKAANNVAALIAQKNKRKAPAKKK